LLNINFINFDQQFPGKEMVFGYKDLFSRKRNRYMYYVCVCSIVAELRHILPESSTPPKTQSHLATDTEWYLYKFSEILDWEAVELLFQTN